MRFPTPDGKIAHAELKIGDSIIFLADEMPGMGNKAPQTLGGTTGGLYLYVEDADKAFQRAIDAGAKSTMPVTDMFWGDRVGHFVDPFGHTWDVSTRVRELTPKEVESGARAFFEQMQRKSA